MALTSNNLYIRVRISIQFQFFQKSFELYVPKRKTRDTEKEVKKKSDRTGKYEYKAIEVIREQCKEIKARNGERNEERLKD